MKRNRRIMSLLLALVLLLGLVPMAFAAESQAQDAAEALYQLGLFQAQGRTRMAAQNSIWTVRRRERKP